MTSCHLSPTLDPSKMDLGLYEPHPGDLSKYNSPLNSFFFLFKLLLRGFYSESVNDVLERWETHIATAKGAFGWFTSAYDPHGAPPDSRLGNMIYKAFGGKPLQYKD